MSAQATSTAKTVSVRLEPAELEWEISPGQAVAGYGYNEQVPGPVLEGNVGDTRVVELSNRLPEPTSIHWHGLRVPGEMDGTELVQKPIQPGESFECRFELPDAGTFWYHPHTNETVQLEKGLYGALVVRGSDEPELDGDRVLVLDDVKLDRKGNLARFGAVRGAAQRPDGQHASAERQSGTRTLDRGGPGRALAGRQRFQPPLRAPLDRGPAVHLSGTDGGLISSPVTASQVLLAPADRVELAVGPFAQGETLAVESLPYVRGMPEDNGGRYATLRVGASQPSRADIPSTLRTIERLVTGDVPPNRTVQLQTRMSLRRGIDWMVEGEAHHHADPVRVGDLQVWDVVNETKMDHPFHLHGFFFQVLDVNGAAPDFLTWEDTVNVPGKGTVRIAWLPAPARAPCCTPATIAPAAGCTTTTFSSTTPPG